METMDEKTTILVRILARVDGLFWPCRDWGNGIQQVLREHRERFFKGLGVAWHSASRNTAIGSNMSRLLSELEHEGAVRLFREKTKVRSVSLSPMKEEQLRETIGLTNRAMGLLFLKQMSDFEEIGKASREPLSQGYIPETLLAGCNYNEADFKKKIWIASRSALYALVHGWIEWGSSIRRQGYYRILPEGRKMLAGGFDVLADSVERYLQTSSEFNPVYDDEIESFWAWLKSQEPDDPGEIAPMPLSCSFV